MKHIYLILLAGLSALSSGCTPASDHARAVTAGRDAQDRMTLGAVQREIRVGMSGSDVVAALGSPNIVTNDDRRRETWVYDKISTEQVYSSSAAGVNVLFLGGGSRAGAAQTSQRTLTVIIRFDEAGKVRDFNYRSSSF